MSRDDWSVGVNLARITRHEERNATVHALRGGVLRFVLPRQHKPSARQPFARLAHTRTRQSENTKCHHRNSNIPRQRKPTDRVHRGYLNVAPSHFTINCSNPPIRSQKGHKTKHERRLVIHKSADDGQIWRDQAALTSRTGIVSPLADDLNDCRSF